MTRLLSHTFMRGAIAAAALSLALLTAAPASAEPKSDPAIGEDILAYNGGGITIDAGPQYAGFDVFVQSQLPATVGKGAGTWTIQKGSLDAQGTARVVNFAGPVNLTFSARALHAHNTSCPIRTCPPRSTVALRSGTTSTRC